MSACFEASCRDVAGLAELDDARQTFPEGMSNSPSANVGDGRVLRGYFARNNLRSHRFSAVLLYAHIDVCPASGCSRRSHSIRIMTSIFLVVRLHRQSFSVSATLAFFGNSSLYFYDILATVVIYITSVVIQSNNKAGTTLSAFPVCFKSYKQRRVRQDARTKRQQS